MYSNGYTCKTPKTRQQRDERRTGQDMSESNIATPLYGREAPAAVPDALTGVSERGLLKLLRGIVSFPSMLAALLAGGVFWSGRMFVVDPDLWWHIKVGDSILATHQFPTVDPYSFTVLGQPWIAYEWLGDVLFSFVHRFGGLRGLDALLIGLGSAIVIALYYLGTLRSGNSKAGFVSAAVLLILATVSFSMRPQMLGYLFLILTLIALERFRQGKSRALWFLPVLFLLWVNTHGSFIIGMGAIFLYYVGGLKKLELGDIECVPWTERERQQLSCAFLFCLIALTITPYGARLAAYPFDMAFSQPINVANIMEWQSMPFNIAGGKIFLGLLLAFMLFQATLRFKWRFEELALFLFGVMMACLHVRFILLFVPFFAPLLATILARGMHAYNVQKDKYALNAALMALVAFGIVHYFPSRSSIERTVVRTFPVDAVNYLRQHPAPGPMYNTYGFGGYLIWTMAPENKVFVDGRGDLYEHGGVLADYLHISTIKPGTLQVLQNYGIQSCLLERDEPLGTLLSASPEWKKTYFDSVSVLYVRKSASYAPSTNR
jgi:hypothetical protein